MAMKISNEIRNWCASNDGNFIDADDCDELRALADRIDKEMFALPKTADGVSIHTGDTVFQDDGSSAEVVRIILENTECHRTLIICSTGGDVDKMRLPFELLHERPDSFERIADELDEMVDGPGPADDVCEMLADIADRIRKLAKK